MDELKLKLIRKSLFRSRSVKVELGGDSMKPLINPGTKVEIIRCKFDEIKVSDIVVFSRTGRLIVHQCIFKTSEYLVAWGVNNNFTDGKVFRNEILGKVKYPLNTNLFNQLLLIEARILNNKLKKIKANPIWLKGPVYNLD